MEQLNEKIVSWLEAGKLKDVLIGNSSYFLMDHTYRSQHDVLLVLNTLIEWAYKSGKVEEYSNQFQKVLSQVSNEMPEKCIDVLLAYVVSSKYIKKKLHFDLEPMIKHLYHIVEHGNNVFSVPNEDLKRRLNNIRGDSGNRRQRPIK